MPRGSDIVSVLPLTAILYRDGYGQVETFSITSLTENGNYIDAVVQFTALKQDESYYLEINNGTELWYRDKIWVTTTTDFNDKYSLNESVYVQYDTDEDNTYIIDG